MRAICWDFDGTLVYSDCLWSGSVWKALKEAVPDTTITLSQVFKIFFCRIIILIYATSCPSWS